MRRSAFVSRVSVAFTVGLLVVTIPSAGSAQGTTLTPYSGYRLGGSLTIREGDLKLDSSPFFGAQLDFRVRADATGAIIVDYQPTTLRLKEFNEPLQELFDMNVWYFQAGGTLEVQNQADAIPFFVGSLGMSWFDPGAGSQSAGSEYALSGVFGAGAKIPLGDGGMGLRLQARVLLNSIYGGASVWCGSASGCWIGTGGYLGPVQFDFGGGVTFGGH
jgi:hypothetical protein